MSISPTRNPPQEIRMSSTGDTFEENDVVQNVVNQILGNDPLAHSQANTNLTCSYNCYLVGIKKIIDVFLSSLAPLEQSDKVTMSQIINGTYRNYNDMPPRP